MITPPSMFPESVTHDPAGRTDRQRVTRALLTRLRDQGYTLEQCADRKIMDRTPGTLKRWCREFGIEFPDYAPRKKVK